MCTADADVIGLVVVSDDGPHACGGLGVRDGNCVAQ